MWLSPQRLDAHFCTRSCESDDANAHAPLHAAHEWVLQEVRDPVHPVVVHAVFYHFTKAHTTLKVTPAMATGWTNRVWDMRAGSN